MILHRKYSICASFFSDPFSPEVIQAVKEQQEDAKYSHPDQNSSNEFKG